jgi:hypothetical protein
VSQAFTSNNYLKNLNLNNDGNRSNSSKPIIDPKIPIKSHKSEISIKFTKTQYFKNFICCCLLSGSSTVRNVYFNSKKFLIKMLDVSNLIKLQIDFNTLKFLLLKDEESVIFNHIPQPNIISLSDVAIKDPYFGLVTAVKTHNEDEIVKLIEKLRIQGHKVCELFPKENLEK